MITFNYFSYVYEPITWNMLFCTEHIGKLVWGSFGDVSMAASFLLYFEYILSNCLCMFSFLLSWINQ